ncbi:MAG: hypothetical protein AAFX58_08285 [Pseudomonadota bacterium]
MSDTAIAVMSAGRHLDGSKAREELGYEATVSVDDMMRRALTWFRETGMVGGP